MPMLGGPSREAASSVYLSHHSGMHAPVALHGWAACRPTPIQPSEGGGIGISHSATTLNPSWSSPRLSTIGA